MDSDNDGEEMFLSRARKEFRARSITPMTRESHPEIMNLYSELCKKSRLREHSIYVAESTVYNSAINGMTGKIVISTPYMKDREPDAICANFGHEQRHLSPQQQAKKLVIAKTASASTFLLAAGYCATALQTADMPGGHAHNLIKYAVIPVSILMTGAIAGAKKYSGYAEYDSDRASAEFAGNDAAIRDLKTSLQSPYYVKKNWLELMGDILSLDYHPPLDKRIRRLEKIAAKNAGGQGRE